MENVVFAPGDQLYNSRFSLGVYYQKCNLKEPYGTNPRRHPPIFIDFLPTNSSRKKHYSCNDMVAEAVEVAVVAGGWSVDGA